MNVWSNFRKLWVRESTKLEANTAEPTKIDINLNITLGGTLRIIHETAEPPPKPKQLPNRGKLQFKFLGETSDMRNEYTVKQATPPGPNVTEIRVTVFDGSTQDLVFLPSDTIRIVVAQDVDVTVTSTDHSDDPLWIDVTKVGTFRSTDRNPPTAQPLPDRGDLVFEFVGEVE